MKKHLMIIAAVFLSVAFTAFTSCTATTVNKQPDPPKAAETNAETKPADNKSAAGTKTESNKPASEKTSETGDKAGCLKAKMDGKRLIASQTFVFNYEPYPNSCFVTFASKEDMMDERDVPRGSTFHIYRNGEIVYDFEDAFDGQSACWVEGVGFEDLNGDKKIEVIIAGKCLGAKDSYPANAVYMNIKDDFRTVPTSNVHLENFTTVRQISDYVKKNNNKFFDDK